ncbi:MAG TPA: hypothetical protein VG271_05015 [Beijerinckiaceae bacterium]|jgi:tripartite-type tricarboxylate transporter receptor subunit TctC|nr:hypothetical protein [Beijerinckiaceae bacterium]
MRARTLSGAAIIFGFLAASPPARAQSDVATFFSKTPIRLVSAAGPGSGFTIWAHFLAQYLGKFVPGNPTVVVESMPGAGGLTATNYTYVIAPKDGSTILSIPREAPILSTMGAKGVQFDSTRFSWLGSPTTDIDVCFEREDAPWRALPDYYSKELLVGSDGVGSGTHIFPIAVNAILGTKFKVIDGYADTGTVFLAVDRGEIHGSCQSAETLLKARGPALASGALKLVLQSGLKPDPAFAGVPFVMDLAKTEEERQALTFLFASMTLGRPFVVPPGTPPDRIAALRKAFSDMFKDPDFLSAAKELHYDINPMSGDDLQKIVDDVAATPRSVVARVAGLIEPAGTR